jgi:hypothetical protein
LKPENLALPESLLRLIPPRPPGYARTREDFKIRTYPAFDALAPAEAFANHVCDFLFNSERAARLIEFHARDTRYPGFDEVLDKIIAATLQAPARTSRRPQLSMGRLEIFAFSAEYEAEVQRTVNMVVLDELMALAANDRASNQVRAMAEFKLEQLKRRLIQQSDVIQDENQKAFVFYAVNQIKRFQDDPKKMNLTKPNDPPDGQPIGMDWWTKADGEWCAWR